jgi:hypothetical protein
MSPRSDRDGAGTGLLLPNEVPERIAEVVVQALAEA